MNSKHFVVILELLLLLSSQCWELCVNHRFLLLRCVNRYHLLVIHVNRFKPVIIQIIRSQLNFNLLILLLPQDQELEQSTQHFDFESQRQEFSLQYFLRFQLNARWAMNLVRLHALVDYHKKIKC